MFKSTFAISLIALPLIVQAGEMPSAPSRPSVSTIALDYLAKEFAARLKPAPGKPFRPDLPGNASYSPEQKAAVETVFGTPEPLRVQRLPGKNGNYKVSVPGREYVEDGTTVNWSDLTLQLGAQPRGAMNIAGNWPSLTVTDKSGRLELRDMFMGGQKQSDQWRSKSRIDIGSIRYSDAASGELFNLQGNRFQLDSQVRKGLASVRFDMTTDRIAMADEQIDGLHIDMRWRNLDIAAIEQIRVISERMRNRSERPAEMTQADAHEVLDLAKLILQRGAALEFNNISASYQGSKVRITASLSMPGVVASDFIDRDAVLKKLVGKVKMNLPLPILRHVANLMAERNTTDQPKDKLAAEIYELMLGKALANNYARLEKGELVSELELKGGALLVNGTSMPLDALLAALDEDEIPPEDGEVPVPISMHQRGLEVARLFAMNGNHDGVHNLCYRYFYGYGVEKNHVEAVKWCSKGVELKMDWSGLLLARIYIDSDQVPRDYAAALGLAQPLAGDGGYAYAQYLMYRLYDGGHGVAKESKTARIYLQQAALGGNEEAIAELKRIEPSFELPAQKEKVKNDPWIQIADVPGGFYEANDYRFDSDKRRSLTLVMSDMKSHEKWAPMQSICLTALMPSDQACLYLQQNGKDSKKLFMYTNVRSTDGTIARHRAELPGELGLGEEVRVQIYVKNKKAYFAVNSNDPLTVPVDFPVEVMRLACSTGKCQFDFQRPETPASDAEESLGAEGLSN